MAAALCWDEREFSKFGINKLPKVNMCFFQPHASKPDERSRQNLDPCYCVRHMSSYYLAPALEASSHASASHQLSIYNLAL